MEDVELETIKLREAAAGVTVGNLETHKSVQKTGSRARILRNVKHEGRRMGRYLHISRMFQGL